MIALLKLWGDLALGDPAFLGLLVLLPILLFWRLSQRVRPALNWGSLAGRDNLPRGLRARLAWVPPVLELLAVGLFIIALARPQKIIEKVENVSKGVDIILCLDVSSSMNEIDLDPDERKSRLTVAKEVADKFIAGRRGDRVGIVSFARFPRILCPPTLDLAAARGFLKSVETVKTREEDGTGIGAGLARAVAMFHKSKAKSRVVVLLTDGQENINEIKPLDAALAAKQYRVRVHSMAAGYYARVPGFFGRSQKQKLNIDTKDLRRVSEMTNGKFFRVQDGPGLIQVWAEIDKMEKTEIKDRRWVDAKDQAGPVILAGVFLLLLALLGLAYLRGLP